MPQKPAGCDSDPYSRFHSGEIVAAKYFLLEPLGAGGMGEVWAARNVATRAEVAIKLLTTHTSTPAGVARLRREAYATGQLAHRGIVRIYDLVDLEDARCPLAMVMERLRGRTLAERLRYEGALSIDATMITVLPILRALHYAHGVGIIHRDLKPDNVFLHVEPDGHIVPKLLDFGVSKVLRHAEPPVTAAGEVVGTPTYMSPEQTRGAEIDARSDVFCAGILVYTCLTRRSPFVPDEIPPSRPSLLTMDRTRPPQIPQPLWRVLARALEANPDDRFATAADLAEALARFDEDAALPEVPTGSANVVADRPPARASRTAVRRRFAAGLLALSAAGALFVPPGRHLAAASARADEDGPTLATRDAPRRLISGKDVLRKAASDRGPRRASEGVLSAPSLPCGK